MPFVAHLYWYVVVAPTPRKLPNVLGMDDPSAFSVGENVAAVLPESTSRIPVLLPVLAGNWVRIEEGTVNVLAPTVVTQMNVVEVVTALLPLPVVAEEEPTISSVSEALPPVQLRVSGELRGTAAGRPPVTVIAEARVSEVLKEPTSLPPAPFKV